MPANLVPRTMQDLLKPEYKGRIASTPYGAMFDYLATDEVWGEQRTLDYVARLTDQLAGVIRCNEMTRVASGEFDVFALACSQSNAYELRARGAPVDILIASDAPFLIPLYLAVPRNAACLATIRKAGDLTRERRHPSSEFASPVMSPSIHRKMGRGGKGEVVHELPCQTRATGPSRPALPRSDP
jgi:hypothetical protein